MSLQRLKLPKTKIIGVGGGGCLILKEIAKKLLKNRFPKDKIEFIGANVDWQALKTLPSYITKFHFGQNVTYGFGCGMNPDLGEKSAKEAEKDFKKIIHNTNFCIFISCLGGGCGSGSTPVFAEIVNSLKIPSLGIFTFPFQFEGRKRYEIANSAYQKIRKYLNANILIKNQKIFEVVKKDVPFAKALSLINDYLANAIGSLLETIYLPGLINIDFADLKSVLADKPSDAYLLIAQVPNKTKAEVLKTKLMNNPLFEYPKEGCQRILFNIFISKNAKMKEIEQLSREILAQNRNSKIIYGLSYNTKDKKNIKILFLGVEKLEAQKEKKPKKINKSVQKKLKSQKKKQKKKVSKTKPPIKEKKRVRRNGLDIQKLIQETEKELFEEEKKWEIPAFLRRKVL